MSFPITNYSTLVFYLYTFYNMKKLQFIFLIFFITTINICMGQNNNWYEQQWLKLSELAYNNKLGSDDMFIALNKIKAQAIKEKNDTAIYMSAIIESHYVIDKQEDANTPIAILEKALPLLNNTFRALMHNRIAQAYKDIFTNKLYQIKNRTAIDQSDIPADIELFTKQDFYKKILFHFTESIKNKAELIKTAALPLADVLDVVSKENNLFSNNLYEILWKDNIDFFENDFYGASDDFENLNLEDTKYFNPVNEFITLQLTDVKTNTLKKNAFELYQNILKEYSGNTNKNEFIYLDIQRLNFVLANSSSSDENLFAYTTALQNIIATYPKEKAINYAKLLLANTLANNVPADDKRDNIETNAFAQLNNRIKAKVIYEQLAKDSSIIAIQLKAKDKLNDITQSRFCISLNKDQLPNQPILADIEFRNVQQVTYYIAPAIDNWNELSASNLKLKIINALTNNDTKKITLPITITPDYLSHKSFITLPALAQGNYVIINFDGADVKNKPNKEQLNNVEIKDLKITTIAAVHIGGTDKTKNNKLVVVHRKTGAPIEGAIVTYYSNNYNNKTNKYERKIIKKAITNTDGVATYCNNNFTIIYKNEIYNNEGDSYMYEDEYEQAEVTENNYTLAIYTDRAIYRPGQTIQIKAIALTNQNNKNYTTLDNKKIKIKLQDPNGNAIESKTITTNKYGSVHTTFIIPSNRISGDYTIICTPEDVKQNNEESFTHYIKVEEYKRPKFEIIWDTVKQTYALNDSITITGKAMGYNGAPLANASAAATISVNSKFIYRWCLPFEDWEDQFNNKIIATQNITTAADGSFSITFKAIPNTIINEKTKPQFVFTIDATITDINGESQSKIMAITVAKEPFTIEVQERNSIDYNKFNTLKITTNNLQNQFVAVPLTITIEKLLQPSTFKLNQDNNTIDTWLVDKASLEKQFPYYSFEKSMEPQYLPVANVVKEWNVTSTADGIINIAAIPNDNALYRITVTSTTTTGVVVKNVLHQRIFGATPAALPIEALMVNTNNTIDNGAINYTILSPITNLKLNKFGQENNINYATNSNVLNVPTTEKILTNYLDYKLNFFAYWENNFFQVKEPFYLNTPSVPANIKIDIKTVREKIAPGVPEQWQVSITDSNNKPLDAEVLTTMYDASLDVFAPNVWPVLPKLGINFIDYPNAYASEYAEGTNIADFADYYDYGPFNFAFNTIKYIQINEQLFVQKTVTNFLSTIKKAGKYKLLGHNIVVKQIPKSKSFYIAEGPYFFRNFGNYGWNLESPQNEGYSTLRFSGATTEAAISYNKIKYDAADANGNNMMFNAFRVAKPPPPPGKPQVKFTPPVIKKNEEVKEEAKPTVTNIVVPIRTNLKETAFWQPALTTDNGIAIIKFTTPEALTKWNWLVLAHTPDARNIVHSQQIITQKNVMVTPNLPRILYSGDKVTISTKVTNLTTDVITNAIVSIKLVDANTLQDITALFINNPSQTITLPAISSLTINFTCSVPTTYTGPVQIIIQSTTATGNLSYSDAEQNTIPILAPQQYIVAAVPYMLTANSSKVITVPSLGNTGIESKNIVLETTTNPSFFALQNLPYLAYYPYDCAEQTFHKLYAFTIAHNLIENNPDLKAAINNWLQTKPTNTLEQNQELKQVLLQETPWNTSSNTSNGLEQLATMYSTFPNDTFTKALARMQQLQNSDGGFGWFKGGSSNIFITEQIAISYYKLVNLIGYDNVIVKELSFKMQNAVDYLDRHYIALQKIDAKKAKENLNYTPYISTTYLLLRSYLNNVKNDKVNSIINFYSKYYFTPAMDNSVTNLATAAILANAQGKASLAKDYINLLTQASITTEENGMYWKPKNSNATDEDIQQHCLAMQAINLVTPNATTLAKLQFWLLKNKRTNAWQNTITTADACYQILNSSPQKFSPAQVTYTINKREINTTDYPTNKSTGYSKIAFGTAAIKNDFKEIKVTNITNNNTVAWGAIYHSYLAPFTNITNASSGLSASKEVFVQKIGVAEGNKLQQKEFKVGDIIIVKLTITANSDMDFVHIKDMRAAGLEPKQTLSGYQYNNGLSFYLQTKDAATNFFIEHLAKGTHTIEYTCVANNAGVFADGVTTIQCMYASEIVGNTTPQRIKIN